jgi:hypothetical protein
LPRWHAGTAFTRICGTSGAARHARQFWLPGWRRARPTSWLDPSSGGLTGKLFFDATKKEGFRGQMPDYPDESMVRARKAIETARALASHVASN